MQETVGWCRDAGKAAGEARVGERVGTEGGHGGLRPGGEVRNGVELLQGRAGGLTGGAEVLSGKCTVCGTPNKQWQSVAHHEAVTMVSVAVWGAVHISLHVFK